MIKEKLLSVLSLTFIWFLSYSQTPTKDIRDFVTRKYFHGVPYEEAKALGSKVIPDLVSMLGNPAYEEFRPNIVLTLGMIGSPDAIKPLKNYLSGQKGEVSYSTFISLLAVFQAMGYIAQSGNQEAITMLTAWSDPDYFSKSRLDVSYKNYKGTLMGSTISNLAIQGLGISGRPEALKVLQDKQSDTKLMSASSTNNSVKGAIKLNNRVRTEGALKVFGKEDLQ